MGRGVKRDRRDEFVEAPVGASRRQRNIPEAEDAIGAAEPAHQGRRREAAGILEMKAEELVNAVVDEEASLAVRRYFTIAGRDPFDEIGRASCRERV